MKVLLLDDVYNLGRAGDVKKVANGFGRNFLLPQGLAVLATPGALKEVERITAEANSRRTILNEEMAGVGEKMVGLQLQFPARAGETGKLYGSVTTQMLAADISEKIGVEISKRQIDSEPLRLLGMHNIKVRLTMDLIPEISVVVYRDGELPENYMVDAHVLAAGMEEFDEEELLDDDIEVENAEEETPAEDVPVVEEEIVEEEVVESEEETDEETE